MKRIIHVVATLDRGGTEVSCLTLVKEFKQHGIENHVVAIQKGAGGIETALKEVAATPIVLLPSARVARFRAFRSMVNKLTPDAVIFHLFNIEHLMLGVAARSTGVHNVVTVMGNPAPPHSNKKLSNKFRLLLALTRLLHLRLVSASAWIEASLAKLGPLPRRAAVIHNGCETCLISKRAAAARVVRRDSDAIVGMVARLDPIKDHISLIDAVALLPSRLHGRRLILRLIGEGALRGDLERRVANKGLADRVIFAGARTDVAEEMGRMDVFVLSTTRDEGFGVVLIEALAAGVPIIASDVSACREVLADGALGTLVPAHDPAALAVALERTLCARPILAPFDEIKRRYDSGKMAKDYLRVISSDQGV